MSWYQNSLAAFRNRAGYNSYTAILVIIVSFITLFHSFYLHQWKRKTVRILVDLCCVASLVTGIVVLISNILYTPASLAIGADLFGFGICSAIIAVCDSLITYTRYKLLSKRQLPRDSISMMDICVGVYLTLFVVGLSLVFYTIVPFFEDVNDGPGLVALNNCLYYGYTPAFGLFNLYFSSIFFKRIIGFRKSKVERHPKLLGLAYRSCGHSLISITMNSYMAYSSMHNPIQAQLCYCIVECTVLHLLFNCKWDPRSLEERMSQFTDVNKIEPIDEPLESMESKFKCKIPAKLKSVPVGVPAELPKAKLEHQLSGNTSISASATNSYVLGASIIMGRENSPSYENKISQDQRLHGTGFVSISPPIYQRQPSERWIDLLPVDTTGDIFETKSGGEADISEGRIMAAAIEEGFL